MFGAQPFFRSCSCSVIPEVPCILWNLQVYCWHHSSLQHSPCMGQKTAVHSFLANLLLRLILICCQHLGFAVGLLHFSFMCTMWHTHMIVLGFIALILFAKQCMSWSSTLCSILWSHITSSIHKWMLLQKKTIIFKFCIQFPSSHAGYMPCLFFVPHVVISAAECALCGSLCSCQSYLQSWVQILCPVASHWPITQIVVKLINRDFVLSQT